LPLGAETQFQPRRARFYFGIHTIAFRQRRSRKAAPERGYARTGGTAADGSGIFTAASEAKML